MSKSARKRANARLMLALFGPDGMPAPMPPAQTNQTRKEQLLRTAKELRALAARGMHPRAYPREAARLEAEANAIPD